MDNAWPKLPVNEGVQSNCWKLVLILGYLQYFIQIIANMGGGAWNAVFQNVIDVIFFTMFQYHSLYYTIEITEEVIEIKGGPCQWCSDWNNKDDIKRWLSASWCFSSQIYKTEITSIITRTVSFWPDWFPRYYCAPIMWCCCHKSYSGWYFPFCCSNVNIGGLCDGDIGPVTSLRYVQFNLSESATACLFPGRCTPNIYSCCTYNRISYVLRDPSVIDQLKQCGYDVQELDGGDPVQSISEPVGTNVVVAGVTDTNGQTNTTASAPPVANANVPPPAQDAQAQQQPPPPADTEGGDVPPPSI